MNRLQNVFELDAPVEEVFEFYSHPENIVRMAPPELNLRILQVDRPLRLGARVLFSTRLRLMPFEVRWLMEIKEYVPNEVFIDRLVKGPFSSWEHSHVFQRLDNSRTRITDTIEFGSPNSMLDRMVGSHFVRRKLEETFHRWEAILRREVGKSAAK